MLGLLNRLRERIKIPERRTDMMDVIEAEPFPPLTDADLANAEHLLGFRLHPLLKSIYREIGNVGFGPGYGFMGLGVGATDESGESALKLYQDFCQPDPDDPAWAWPERLIPVCNWGCAIYSCIDCAEPDGAMVVFDPNGHGPGTDWGDAFRPESESLERWLTDWLDGVDLWERMYPFE